MKLLGFSVAAAGLMTMLSTGAGAMPLPPVPGADAPVVQVAGGCGPYGHRTPWGRCVPNGRPFFRACPPGFHLGPYGRRCWPN